MPIYEYQCDACAKRQEIMRRLADKPLKKCPLCGERKLRKLVSAAAFRFKGGGWYETDFKDEKSRKNISKADEGGTDKAEAKTEVKTETETEAKTDKAEKKTETVKETSPKVEAKAKEKEKKKGKKTADD